MIRAIIASAWLVLAAVWLVTSVFAKPAVRVQSPGSRLFHVVMTVAGYLLIFNGSWYWGPLDQIMLPRSPGIVYGGVALTIAGVLFAIWARFYLGGNWSGSVTVKQDHQLVRSGPYSVVRHPIYTGIVFAGLGTSIAFGRIRCFVGVLVLTIGFKLKSLLEERFMQEQFGAQYLSYKQNVKALVPFIW